MRKMAEALQEKSDHPATILGKSLLGLGIGAGAGYGAGMGLDHLLGKSTGSVLPASTAAKLMPIVTGALGMAYPYFHQTTVQNMQKSYRERQEEKGRGSKHS